MSDQYNIAAIRNLITDAFTAKELRRFCQERPSLSPVVDRFGSDLRLEEMVDDVVEYCQKKVLVAELLSEIRDFNPGQYERYKDQLYVSEPSQVLDMPPSPLPSEALTKEPLDASPPPSLPGLTPPTSRLEEGEQLPVVEIVTFNGVRVRGWLIDVLRDPVFQGIGCIVAVLALVVAIGTWFWPDISALLFPDTPTPTPASPTPPNGTPSTTPILTLNLKLDDQIVEGQHTVTRDVAFIRVEVEMLSDGTPVPSNAFKYRWSFNPPDAKNQDTDWSEENTIYYYLPEELQYQAMTIEVRGSDRQWSRSIHFAIAEE